MNYTEQQLQARNRSIWTKVQGYGALIQFLTFITSLVLVIRFLATGQGYEITTVFCVAKVLMLYFMTVTGMAWEEEVFGQMFMAREFFWEDAGNLVSLAGNTAYLVVLLNGADKQTQMLVMLIALATYVLNFVQFGLRGVRTARQRRAERMAMSPAGK
jgi:3-vinyl bacteriochlorophyllide hydratase